MLQDIQNQAMGQESQFRLAVEISTAQFMTNKSMEEGEIWENLKNSYMIFSAACRRSVTLIKQPQC